MGITEAPRSCLQESTGLDQLQHLGTKTTSPPLPVQSLEDETGRRGEVAGISVLPGLTLAILGSVQQVMTIRRFRRSGRGMDELVGVGSFR